MTRRRRSTKGIVPAPGGPINTILNSRPEDGFAVLVASPAPLERLNHFELRLCAFSSAAFSRASTRASSL